MPVFWFYVTYAHIFRDTKLVLTFYATFCYSKNYMSPEWTFGKRLQYLRQEKGYSQRDLAKKVLMDFTYLSKIENGKMDPPRKKVIEKLAEILGADLNELLGLAGEIPGDLKTKIEKSDAARRFICRHAATLNESEWENLLKAVEKKNK